MTVLWEVDITYCNDVHFNHPHTEAKAATQEYADQMLEAFDPLTETEDSKVVHVREVTLRGMNAEGDVNRDVSTGVITCPHRGE